MLIDQLEDEEWQSKLNEDELEVPDDSFPLSGLNDDYCDCPETGIDETSTNACHKGIFHCQTKYSIPRFVTSAKINDGICDCCDCSDEFLTPSKITHRVKGIYIFIYKL